MQLLGKGRPSQLVDENDPSNEYMGPCEVIYTASETVGCLIKVNRDCCRFFGSLIFVRKLGSFFSLPSLSPVSLEEENQSETGDESVGGGMSLE